MLQSTVGRPRDAAHSSHHANGDKKIPAHDTLLTSLPDHIPLLPFATTTTAAAKSKWRSSFVSVFVMVTLWMTILVAHASEWSRFTAVPVGTVVAGGALSSTSTTKLHKATLHSVHHFFRPCHSKTSSGLHSPATNLVQFQQEQQLQKGIHNLHSCHTSLQPQQQRPLPVTPPSSQSSSSRFSTFSTSTINSDVTLTPTYHHDSAPHDLPNPVKPITMTASSSISSSSFTVSDATRGQHVISTHAGTPLSPHTRPIKQQQHKQPQPPQQRQASSFNGNRNSARLRQRELAAAALNRRVYPDHPIGFEYTIYYPGNMDLIITAGHGGYNAPGEVLSPRLTHIYRPCLSQEREGERDSTGDGEWTRRTVVDSIDCFAVPVVDDEPLAAAAAAEGNVDGLYPPPLPLQTPPSSSHSAHTTAESGQPPPPPPQYQHQQQLPGLVTRPPRSRAHQPTHQEKFMLPPGPITTMPNLPLRDTSRGGNFRGDMNTSTLAMHLALSISDLLVSSAQQPQSLVASRPRPHVVLFRVPRRFVDVNRNISNPEENAVPENSSESAAAWHEYHGVIDHVRALIETGIERRCQKQRHRGNKDNQRGLLLDIHGHTHATELIEIGYLLDGATLAQEDAVLDARAAELAQIMSTLSPFKEWRKEDVNTPLSFSSILRGPNDSLGGMFQQQGLNAVPSPRNQAPCDECLFFFGGYTIQRHGSRDGGNTDAIQLELPKSLRFVEREEMRVISMQMARAVVEFLGRYYDLASTTATDDRSMQDRSARATSASVTVVMARPILSSLPPQGPGVLVAAAAAAATAVGNRNLMHHPSTTGLYRSYSSPLSASSRHRAVDNESGDDDSDQERVSRSNRQTAKAAAIVAASDEPRPALLRKSSRL